VHWPEGIADEVVSVYTNTQVPMTSAGESARGSDFCSFFLSSFTFGLNLKTQCISFNRRPSLVHETTCLFALWCPFDLNLNSNGHRN